MSCAIARSYVSDGYAHAVKFTVDGRAPGNGEVRLERAGDVNVKASVAFAPETPKAVAYGQLAPPQGRRMVGDTINLHAPRTDQFVQGGLRLVEIVVNGQSVAQIRLPADGKIHDVQFTVPLDRSSWIALRHFPQLHTNPVHVVLADQPIRASRDSAFWCAETIKLLWKNRSNRIAEHERARAYETYQKAIQTYLRRASEAPEGS